MVPQVRVCGDQIPDLDRKMGTGMIMTMIIAEETIVTVVAVEVEELAVAAAVVDHLLARRLSRKAVLLRYFSGPTRLRREVREEIPNHGKQPRPLTATVRRTGGILVRHRLLETGLIVGDRSMPARIMMMGPDRDLHQ